MKHILLAVLLLALPQLSHARDTLDGCGLGWEVTEDETMIATATRSSTNIFVPPTFGMTSGTLGCKQTPIAANDKEALNYAVSNFVNLKQELASGKGEYAEGLSELMNCNSGVIQQKYEQSVLPAQNGVELFKNLKGICG